MGCGNLKQSWFGSAGSENTWKWHVTTDFINYLLNKQLSIGDKHLFSRVCKLAIQAQNNVQKSKKNS